MQPVREKRLLAMAVHIRLVDAASPQRVQASLHIFIHFILVIFRRPVTPTLLPVRHMGPTCALPTPLKPPPPPPPLFSPLVTTMWALASHMHTPKYHVTGQWPITHPHHIQSEP